MSFLSFVEYDYAVFTKNFAQFGGTFFFTKMSLRNVTVVIVVSCLKCIHVVLV
jgi:hypothetical protein